MRIEDRTGLKRMMIGIALGGIGALALTRLLASLLFGVSPTDPPTFVRIALLLTSVTLLAFIYRLVELPGESDGGAAV